MALIGKVVAITGTAYLISGNGDKRELALGDVIETGDTIKTLNGAEVELELATARPIHIGSEQVVAFTEELSSIFVPNALDSTLNLATIETVIKAIEDGKDIGEALEETAAGPNGLFNTYGFGFVDLLRINDILNQFGFNYDFNFTANIQDQPINDRLLDGGAGAVSVGATTSSNIRPIATASAVSGNEDATGISVSFAGSDTDGTIASYRVAALPLASQGVLYLANGTTPVTTSMLLTPAQAFSLLFTPTANFNGIANISFTAIDNNGATSLPADVVVTVNAIGDAPVIAGVGAGSVTEDTTFTSTGTLTITDPDAGESSFQPQTNVATSYGSFTIDAAGVWSYTLNNSNPTVQALPTGSTLTDTVSVLSADGTPTTVVITINGTDETATIGVGAVEEDVTLASTGTLTASGVATFVPASAAGTYGSFNVLANGDWTYTLNNANPIVQALNQGESHLESFTVTLSDGSTTSVNITVTGTNDVATLTSQTVALTESNAVLNTGGTLTLADLDATDATVVAQAATAGTYGTFSINAAGVWTYVTSSALNQLDAGQVVTEVFTVATSDGGSASVTVNITGTNDAPVLAVGSTLAYTENGAAAAIDTAITVADVDNTTLSTGTVAITTGFVTGQDVLAFSNVPATMGNITGVYNAATGIMSLSSAGNTATTAQWQAAMRAVTYANSSDNPNTAVRTVSYSVNDSALNSNTVTSTINITAVNDAPVNTVPAAQTTAEDTPRVFSVGNSNAITVSDLDDAATVLTTTITITNGTFTALAFAGATITNNNSGVVTIQGTAAAINGALNGASFVNTPDFSGATGNVQVSTSDGIAPAVVSNIGVIVTAVGDTVNDVLTINKNTAITFNPITGTNGASADNFEGATPQITQIGGVNITAGGAAVAVTGGSVTLATGNVLTFTPTTGFTGTVPAFTYTVSSGGVTETGSISVNVRPEITINDITVAENIAAGFATFTVTLSAASAQTITVGYSTSNGTAIAGVGNDYTSVTNTLTFTPGQTSQTFTVPINNDTTDEPNETFFVNLSGATNAVITDSQGVGTITDNDAVPTISSITTDTEIEGISLVHTVTLSNASSVATTFAYSLGGGTATSGTDYGATPTFSNGVTLSGGILTVPAGVTSFTVTITSALDVIDEGAAETYNLVVGGVTGVGTITDDDAAPTLSVSNVNVSEVAGSFAIFTLSLSAPSSTAVTVNLALAGVTTGPTGVAATAGTDFTNATQISTDGGITWSGNVTAATFAAGSTSVLVRTAILEDADTTAAEDFRLTATESVVGTTANGTAAGFATIVERNITSVGSPTVTEGGNLDFAVVLPTGTASTYSVNVLGGSTASATDYGTPTIVGITGTGTVTLVGNVLTVAAGVTGFTIRYATTNDILDEANETIVLNVGGRVGTGTITDNDATPTLSINDVTVNEAAGTMIFTVTLSAASGQTVSVNYGMINQTALSGSDFTAGSGTLTFAPGTTTQTITVPILNDSVYEGSETFRVNLSGATNATIADGIGIGTIRDDGAGAGGTDNDTPTFAVSSISVSDQAAGFAQFVVSLSNPSATATTFSLALANVTATGGGVDYGSGTATNIQVSTDNGATWSNATSATIPINGTYVLVRTPIIADVANEVSETFTLTATRTAGTTTNASAVGTATVTDVNNGPDAISDAPVSNLQEDTANTVLAGNAILGGSGNVADTDPNNDTLSITGAVAGTGAVVGSVSLGSPLTVSGIYGTLLINANGSYTYTLDNSRIQTQNILGGQTVSDVFTYKITDGNGAFDTATISVAILGTLDLTAITPVPVPIIADGLSGEYYGYNDTVIAGNRVHADDTLATQIGTTSNIQSVEDVEFIINGRNVAMGGSGSIVGTSNAGAINAADVKFSVRSLNYGNDLQVDEFGNDRGVNGNLGTNPNLAAGSGLSGYDFTLNNRELSNFLYTDSSTAVVQTGAPVGATVGTQTGLGTTTDAIIRMSGFAYLERGNYDFRVYADDGFRLKVGGETLIEFDGNQPPTTRTFNNVEVSDLISGFTSIELLYWEQGGNANLQFEFKLSSSATWVPFSLDSIAFFSAANLPTITDTRIQDVVETAVNQQYELRTGSVLDGDNNTNTLVGDAGRDYIQGLAGADTLLGGGSADFLDGGDGNDILDGGDGADVLIGGTGNDTMTGGLGDDIYRIDSASDVIVEAAGEGTDNIELDASFNPGTYTLAANFENASSSGALNINITGNAAANRILGNDGNNTLSGLAGDDRLIGGKGNDTLTGGADRDIFEWNLTDKGTAGAPAIDTITDFVYTGRADGVVPVAADTQRTDALDLRDLLVNEASTLLNTGATPNIGNLLNYIDININGANTELRISSTGGFASGTYSAAAEDQRIVLTGINLYAATGATAGNETQLLQRLIANGTLVVD